MMQRRHIWQDAPWDALEAYQAFCDERGITMLEATFGWLLSRPALSSVIAGATSAEQVRANARAASAWTPTADDLARIDATLPAAPTTPLAIGSAEQVRSERTVPRGQGGRHHVDGARRREGPGRRGRVD